MTEFMEAKTQELSGAALDWAVAKATCAAELVVTSNGSVSCIYEMPCGGKCWTNYYEPSTDWGYGGPLIEAEELTVEPSAWDWKGTCVLWRAQEQDARIYFEHTNLLVAAMRAVVYAKLGDTVQVPKELCQ